jgi:hypothetical protein
VLLDVIADRGDKGREGAFRLLGMVDQNALSAELRAKANDRLLGFLEADATDPQRGQILEALDLSHDPKNVARAEPLLLKLARDADPDVREKALSALGVVGSTAAQGELLRVAQSATETAELRVDAIARLDPSKEPRAAGAILALTADRAADVRVAAFNRFDTLDGAVALRRLTEAFPVEPELKVREAILEQLKDLGDASTVALLEAFVKEERNPVEERAYAKKQLEGLRERLAPTKD